MNVVAVHPSTCAAASVDVLAHDPAVVRDEHDQDEERGASKPLSSAEKTRSLTGSTPSSVNSVPPKVPTPTRK